MAFSFFFRDSQTLELAIDQALPGLRGQAFIHVWDAGCAWGSEPYTVAILLRERMSDFIFRNVRIHASDIDPGFAQKVTEGVFTEQEVKRIPSGVLDKYFRPASSPGAVQVVPELRAKVKFYHHDLLSLRPIREGVSLVVCKNVLLHVDETQRVQILRMFHHALRSDGLLVLEHTQKLPETVRPLFQQIAPYVQVFRKVDRSLAVHAAESAAPHCPVERQARRVGGAHLTSIESDARAVGAAHPISTSTVSN